MTKDEHHKTNNIEEACKLDKKQNHLLVALVSKKDSSFYHSIIKSRKLTKDPLETFVGTKMISSTQVTNQFRHRERYK